MKISKIINQANVSGPDQDTATSRSQSKRSSRTKDKTSLFSRLTQGACLALLASPMAAGARPMAPGMLPGLPAGGHGRKLLDTCNFRGGNPTDILFTGPSTSVINSGTQRSAIVIPTPGSGVVIEDFSITDPIYLPFLNQPSGWQSSATYGGEGTRLTFPSNTLIDLPLVPFAQFSAIQGNFHTYTGLPALAKPLYLPCSVQSPTSANSSPPAPTFQASPPPPPGPVDNSGPTTAPPPPPGPVDNGGPTIAPPPKASYGSSVGLYAGIGAGAAALAAGAGGLLYWHKKRKNNADLPAYPNARPAPAPAPDVQSRELEII